MDTIWEGVVRQMIIPLSRPFTPSPVYYLPTVNNLKIKIISKILLDIKGGIFFNYSDHIFEQPSFF